MTQQSFWLVEWYKKIQLTPSSEVVRFRRFKLFREEQQAREWANGRDVEKVARINVEGTEATQ